ncbi:unnamed protein product [marine sediment metagenome]|uniref:Uncharacterized protein n=1 Tax=marine sediment metagenome TaxID=412755 RepID=X0ZWY4_9ZZZZ
MNVIDDGIYDAVTGFAPQVVEVATGILAIAYQGAGNDGWLKTFSVDGAGNIGAIIDFLEFDTASGYYPRITEARPGIFAIAYWEMGTGGILKTVDIDAVGNIGAVQDTLMFDVASETCDIVTISTGIVAIFYRGADDDGWIKTYPIDAVGNIGAMIDTLEFDGAYATDPRVIPRGGGDIYTIVYTSQAAGHNTGKMATVDIDSAGNIGAVQDSWVFDPADGNNPKITQISGDVHCIVFSRDVAGEQWGRMGTVNVETDGTITGHAFIADYYFDTTRGKFPNIIHISDTTYAIAYQGTDGDGFVILIDIADDGTIGSITDTLEFDDYDCNDLWLISVAGDVRLVAYWRVNGAGEGILKTLYIKTPAGIVGGLNPALIELAAGVV